MIKLRMARGGRWDNTHASEISLVDQNLKYGSDEARLRMEDGCTTGILAVANSGEEVTEWVSQEHTFPTHVAQQSI